MVRNYMYIRKSLRKKWSDDAMAKALEAVKNNEMGLKKASVQFGVPRATLQRRVQGKVKPLCSTLGRFQVCRLTLAMHGSKLM